MAKSITLTDIPTDNTGFLDRFISFSVQKERDGKGGFAIMGTVSVNVLDSDGQPHRVASLTKELPAAAAASLRDFIKTHYLADLKAQEGL